MNKADLFLQQKPNGNFDVVSSASGLTVAVVVSTSLGWRVMTRTTAGKNSRTHSATAMEAVQKYFGRKLPEVRNA